MTRLAQTLTVANGVHKLVELPGSYTALAALRFYNYSPFTLKLLIAGQSPIIPPEMRDIIYIDPDWYWDGSIDILPVLDLNQNLNISSTVYLVGYGMGEHIPGQDPAPMTRTVASTLTASSVVNTGNPAGTPELTGNATGTAGNIVMNNDGSRTVELQDLGGAAIVEQLINGVGVGHASLVYGLSTNQALATFWGTLGKILADPSAPLTTISSDGNGNLTAHEFKANVSTVGGNQNCIVLSDSVTSRSWALAIVQTSGELSFFETLASKTMLLLDTQTGFAAIGGPLKLLAGIQESRKCGGGGTAAATGNVWKFWIPFQKTMTNLPSSVTLAAISNTNVSAESATDISVDGFMLRLTAAAAGDFVWTGTYTTVGN